jgi:hypothetical protein
MTRKLAVALILCVSIAVPLRADLKCSMHSEMKASNAPAPDAAANPLLAMLAGQLAKQLLPEGAADTDYLVTDKGVRTEYVKGGLNMEQEGAVTLLLLNGDFIHLNTKDKTYWKTTAAAMKAMLEASGIQPQVTSKPSTETATIAGVSSKRVDVEIKIPLPIPEELRAQMPPGFPTEIVMTSETWMATTPYEKYVPVTAKVQEFMGSALGIGRATEPGILMRQILRGSVLGGQQLETIVTKISEEAAPGNAFDIPADYKEVPSPLVK